jgi:hypothetical protein
MPTLVVFDFDETLIPVDSDRYVVQTLGKDQWPQMKEALLESGRQHQWTKGMDNAMQTLHRNGISQSQIIGAIYGCVAPCFIVQFCI